MSSENKDIIDLSGVSLYKAADICTSGNPRLTVVMIHGIASNAETFKDALDYLAKKEELSDVRFVTFDLLGSGKSLTDDRLDYGYGDQIRALHNAISELKCDTPLILVGHSMGSFIVTRYASEYVNDVSELILISSPVYTVENLHDPIFAEQMAAFKKIVAAKDARYISDMAFDREVEKIILNEENYGRLLGIKIPVTFIYSPEDMIIAPFNIHKMAKSRDNMREIQTMGTHKVARDKYVPLGRLLEEKLHEVV